MKLLNNTAAIIAASAIPVVSYLAVSGIQKNDRLSEENNKLRIELVQKNSKIDSLTHDVAELKRQKAEVEYKQELDSLNKFYPKNLGTDFYERIVNNAAFLDNYWYPYTRMKQVVFKIPVEEMGKIHDQSEARFEASKNLSDFVDHFPIYFEE